MQNHQTFAWALLIAFWAIGSSAPIPAPQTLGPCVPRSEPFYGYTFIDADLVNIGEAYAPFFLRFGDHFDRNYNAEDVLRRDNCIEWSGRFCNKANWEEVAAVIYEADEFEIAQLHRAAADPTRKTTLPYRLQDNNFAYVIAYNGCVEVTRYLTFAKKCEQHVVAHGDKWTPAKRDVAAMMTLIEEGKQRFYDSESHFVRMRYAYQIIRLAHYAGAWQMTLDLFDELIPKIDRKKKSIVFFWTLGHVAGAMQKLGRYAEAAYRYAIIFRFCPSKRAQALQSFRIRNDEDWLQTLKLCKTDEERIALYIMRAGGSHIWAVADMEAIYQLNPYTPQLELLLVSDVQELEKVFLRSAVTDAKHGHAIGKIKKEAAVQHLLELQKFVRKVVRQNKVPNPKTWRALDGYLELLANDRYAASKTWDRLEKDLKNNEKDSRLLQQLEIWRCLLDVMNLDTSATETVDKLSYKVRSLNAFKQNPYFEPFLKEWISASYAAHNRPGKAIIAAYPPLAVRYNPKLEVLDDLLLLAEQNDPVLLEKTMMIDTNPERIKAYFLETKGTYFLSRGQLEAAALTLRKISPSEQSRMVQFRPFASHRKEKIYNVNEGDFPRNRLQIVEELLEMEQQAKAFEAMRDSNEAKVWMKLGDFWYNTSYFGYAWSVRDYVRDWHNQLRLAQGPVFPYEGAPHGNWENLDTERALSYYEKAYHAAQSAELKAKAAFMAARCQQKMWLCSPTCNYRPGSKLIPVLPAEYMKYYDLLIGKYSATQYYQKVVKECKWLAAYAR